MAKINKRFCKLTNEQFIAQRDGDGFEKYTIVFISDTKKIWHDGIEYGVNDSEIGEVIKDWIVNDLTTGGADKALSAEQGKQLKTLVDQINAEIAAVKEYTVNGHKISENPTLDKTDVGLGNVTNDAQVKRDEMGIANGVATLDEDGKVPVSQLRGEMARVFGIEKAVATKSALPEVTGVAEGDKYYVIDEKKIYAKATDAWDEGTTPKEDTIYNFRLSDATGSEDRKNILYRWDGKDLVEISSSIALGETAGTAYEGSKGKANADAIASLPSALVSDIIGVGATQEEVNINFKAASKSDGKYGAAELVQRAIPGASKETAGVMTVAQVTELEQLRTDMTAMGNHTVNGHKISENPALNGADIALTGFTELPEETVNEALKPTATDTVNQATAKLYKAIIDNEEVVASAFAELIKSVGLDEHLKYVNKPEDLTAEDIAGVIAEINTKVNDIKSQYETTKSDYEAFKAQFDWYEGE